MNRKTIATIGLAALALTGCATDNEETHAICEEFFDGNYSMSDKIIDLLADVPDDLNSGTGLTYVMTNDDLNELIATAPKDLVPTLEEVRIPFDQIATALENNQEGDVLVNTGAGAEGTATLVEQCADAGFKLSE